MILPIHIYNSKILKTKTKEIDKNFKALSELIKNMFETMYSANGVGLAAPQVGLPIRLFIIDSYQLKNNIPKIIGIKQAFINPLIVNYSEEENIDTESCLSLPNLKLTIKRKNWITINYFDENFNFKKETFYDYEARIIQHEYDHLEGILIIDKINPIEKKLINLKLNYIARGKIKPNYKYIIKK